MDLLERKKLEDSIQEEFNNYKRAGSTLLQANRIDAKKYYANVRNKGIQLGLLTENDYPTDLPSWAEPVMRVTGATLGAVAGGAVGIAGKQRPLMSASVGAGLGGAAATGAYRELAELLNPDLPLAPIGKKMSDVGIAGAIDFGGTMVVGGLFNGVGALLGKGKQISQRGVQNLGNKSNEALKDIARYEDGTPIANLSSPIFNALRHAKLSYEYGDKLLARPALIAKERAQSRGIAYKGAFKADLTEAESRAEKIDALNNVASFSIKDEYPDLDEEGFNQEFLNRFNKSSITPREDLQPGVDFYLRESDAVGVAMPSIFGN